MNKFSFILKSGAINFSLAVLVLFFCTTTWASPLSLRQQTQQQITGTVSDATGPLPAVTVTVKGKIASTLTDQNGYFSITATVGDTLVFSFMGYKTVEITVNNQDTIKVQLQEDATALKEVVVNAGYYSVKDKERTGSIARITAKDIETQPVTNVLATMQGRMAGVDVIQNTGMPGGGFDIRIRGLNSLRAVGNAPLFIVDGVPFASDAIGNTQTSTNLPTATSPLNTLTPTDIESIEVLKDADATAIYGSRGANGVVLITTKRGKTGKTQFAVSSSTAFGQVISTMDLLNTEQYITMREQAFANDNIATYPATAYDINGTWDRNRYTDWQKELTGRTAQITSMQASVSGGSAQTHFLISGTTFQQGTVFPGNFVYKKGGVHAQLDHESIDKRFKVSFSGSYDIQDNDQPSRDLTRVGRNLAPNAPALYNENGELNWENSTWENPLAALRAKALAKTNNVIANTLFTYVLPYGFTAKGSFGFTDLRHEESRSNPSTVFDPIYAATAQNSSIFVNTTNRQSWIVEPQIQWMGKASQAKIEVLIGATYQHTATNRMLQQGSNFTSNSLLYNMASAALVRVLSDDDILYRYQAFFGRLNLAWDSTYFINITGRRDGSSRFGSGKQFATFGAIGAAWIFTEASFFKDHFSFLSFGKVRGSYGITGNDQIGDYQYLDTYQSSTALYDGGVGLAPIRLFNPNFSWETNKKLEAALELGFFNDRIFATASWYQNRSSNQLVGMPLPSTTGFTSIQSNLDATIENRGIELSLRAVPFQNKDFGWTTNFNISFSKNKLLQFPGLETSTYRNQYVIGKSINIQKLYQVTGVNSETGIYEFKDFNGDGILTFADDAQVTKDLNPEYFGGLQNQIRYKRLQLDFLFQFVKQQNWNAASYYSTPGAFSNQPTSVLGSWQQTGDVVSTQLYTSGTNSAAANAYGRYAYSNAAITDASYIRLKNISLTYNVPTGSKGFECRLNIQAQNLLTFTNCRRL